MAGGFVSEFWPKRSTIGTYLWIVGSVFFVIGAFSYVVAGSPDLQVTREAQFSLNHKKKQEDGVRRNLLLTHSPSGGSY